MSDIVIQAENLGKKYTISHQTERSRYVALRDVNAKAQSFRHLPFEAVWALKDVNFKIRRGETVGGPKADRRRTEGIIRAQRSGQVHGVAQTQHLAQGVEPHHRAERRAGDNQRPRSQPAGDLP